MESGAWVRHSLSLAPALIDGGALLRHRLFCSARYRERRRAVAALCVDRHQPLRGIAQAQEQTELMSFAQLSEPRVMVGRCARPHIFFRSPPSCFWEWREPARNP